MTRPYKEASTALILEAIDEGLRSILGEGGKTVVYYHLRNTFGIDRKDIPANIEAFTAFLHQLFGYGAKTIEDAILKSLCSKLGISYEEAKNAKLADCIKKLASRN